LEDTGAAMLCYRSQLFLNYFSLQAAAKTNKQNFSLYLRDKWLNRAGLMKAGWDHLTDDEEVMNSQSCHYPSLFLRFVESTWM